MAKLSPKEFIQIWQSSQTLDEVVERTGMFKTSVNSRAYGYRRKGVPLKKFKATRGVSEYDWGSLAEYAEKSLDESFMDETFEEGEDVRSASGRFTE